MKLSNKNAPVHTRFVCAGVFVFMLLASACEKGRSFGGRDRTLELQGDTVQLDAGVSLHDVDVRAVGNGDFEPAQVTARSGDVVRFTIADTRTHALVITAPTPQGTHALQATGQLRSPPLIARGQAWVVSLKGVPAGSYTVSCISHAGRATLLVQ